MKEVDIKLRALQEDVMKPVKNGGTTPRPDDALQWIYTPAEAIIPTDKRNSFFKNKDICVIINSETAGHLRNLDVDPNRITCLAECDERVEMAKLFGVKDKNIIRITKVGKKIMFVEQDDKESSIENKKFDIVMTNSDFKILKETRQLCYRLAKKHIIMVSDSAYYHGHTSRLKDVEDYYGMGNIFYRVGTAKVGAVLSIINVKGADTLTIHDRDGKTFVYNVKKNGLPRTPPGDNINEWRWGEKILKQNLPGYTYAVKGELSRENAKFKKNGTPVYFTGGRRDEEFNKSNFADKKTVEKWNTKAHLPKEEKSYQKNMEFNTKFWTTAEVSNAEKKAGGYGKHKVVCSHASPDSHGDIPMKYVAPKGVCGMNCWWIECPSKKEALRTLKYFQDKKVIKLIRVLKSNAISNSKSQWSKIPLMSYTKRWK